MTHRLSGVKLNAVYLLMLLAFVLSVAFSHAATVGHDGPHPAIADRIYTGVSVAFFVAIGCLSVVAGSFTEANPRAARERAAMTEQTGDEPILALRAWRTTRRRGALLLQSWHQRHVYWPAGREMRAEPASLGIHAFKSARELLAYVGPEIGDDDIVVGTVALWGTVIEHEAGWTAEKAYPVEIYAVRADTAESVRRAYGCEATVSADGISNAVVRLEAKLRA